MRCSRARCSRPLLRQRLGLPLEVGGTVGDHFARLAVALTRLVVALARAVDGLGLQVAPSAGTARGPQQRRGNADADDQRGNRSRIFPRRVVSASIAVLGLTRHVVESLSHLARLLWMVNYPCKGRAALTAAQEPPSFWRKAPGLRARGGAGTALAPPAARLLPACACGLPRLAPDIPG